MNSTRFLDRFPLAKIVLLICIVLILAVVMLKFTAPVILKEYIKQKSDTHNRNEQNKAQSLNNNKIVPVDADEWENMFSFLHTNTHGVCEHIFERQYKHTNYESDLDEYYNSLKDHDDYIKSMKNSGDVKKRCHSGYSAMYPTETYAMWHLAKLPFVNTICETGFNGGHSVHLWLLANPKAKVYSFDLGEHSCARPMAEYLKKKFPGRLTVTFGDSTVTMPKFIKENPNVKCDLMIIDGGHTYEVGLADKISFRQMTRGPDNIIFIDNYPDINPGDELARVWETAKRRGEIYELFQCHFQKLKPGFSFGRFLINEDEM